MIVHVFRNGESDIDGLHIEADRVTLRDGERFGVVGRALIVGTLPDLTTVPFADIAWFWIEES